MYVDDFISSFPNVSEAIVTHTQLVNLFQKGGFKLTKWMSNSNDLLSTIPEPLQLVKTKQFDKSVSKVLGLQWEEKCDNFSFGLEIPSSTRCTKRNMLSLVARMFDPLGFLSPITLLLKIWIKKLWTLKVDWDSTVPKEIEIAWEKFQNEFHVLYKIQIPRHIAVTPNSSLSFVGFSDASAAGYAAIVYSRVVNCTGQVKVTLLYSQSKVSPMSKITLPRLELCGALLLSKLLSHAIETYSPRHNIDKIFALSDSMIVLNWIKSSEKNLKIFVQNRVVTIHKMVPSEYWFFVPGKENVVDCASRGLFPSSLVNHSTWFTGPNWLLLEPEYWPIQSVNGQEIMICDSEYRSQTFFGNVTRVISPLYTLIEYFSSWSKLLNSTVYVLRFLRKLSLNKRISLFDLKIAEIELIRAVQQKHFSEEYKALSQNLVVKSSIRRLNPFIENGIIRVGGRLSNSQCSFEQKHPILLPKADPLTILLIDYFHKLHLHAGALKSIASEAATNENERDEIEITERNIASVIEEDEKHVTTALFQFKKLTNQKPKLSSKFKLKINLIYFYELDYEIQLLKKWRKVQNVGLSSEYKNGNSEIGKWLKHIFGLMYLPPSQVGDGFVEDFMPEKPDDH
ncbi:uncharacterized protein LOC126886185 [Diabrotica virgifera virgifera]|uniref:Uncharacterized protein n=1 Tax=Diabrotica virgifera virgifera TaxID=50390 RepID=A0ABM5KFL7_DIAVI|nr:uncharacterized protein LOC126886185 [Diabrotica virgifera virgifera]